MIYSPGDEGVIYVSVSPREGGGVASGYVPISFTKGGVA